MLLAPIPYAKRHALTFWFSVPSLAIIAFTVYRCPKDGGWEGPVVPLGEPLPGQAAVILDAERRLLPPGEIGELYLGGAQVAPSYWQSPEATAARFFDLDVPGYRSRRWFGTGDLASQHPVSDLVFHGRRDHQVKIRGYRVELAEIEAQLRRLKGTDEVAVIPWPFTPDGSALGVIAYGAGMKLPATALRERCAEVLPEYMVPTELHELPALPVNASGKRDYTELRRLREEQEKQASR